MKKLTAKKNHYYPRPNKFLWYLQFKRVYFDEKKINRREERERKKSLIMKTNLRKIK